MSVSSPLSSFLFFPPHTWSLLLIHQLLHLQMPLSEALVTSDVAGPLQVWTKMQVFCTDFAHMMLNAPSFVFLDESELIKGEGF